MSYSVLGKAMKNVRKQRSQACNNQRKKDLFGIEPNYHAEKWFSINLLAVEMKNPPKNKKNKITTTKKQSKTKVLMNKPVYLALSLLDTCVGENLFLHSLVAWKRKYCFLLNKSFLILEVGLSIDL